MGRSRRRKWAINILTFGMGPPKVNAPVGELSLQALSNAFQGTIVRAMLAYRDDELEDMVAALTKAQTIFAASMRKNPKAGAFDVRWVDSSPIEGWMQDDEMTDWEFRRKLFEDAGLPYEPCPIAGR